MKNGQPLSQTMHMFGSVAKSFLASSQSVSCRSYPGMWARHTPHAPWVLVWGQLQSRYVWAYCTVGTKSIWNFFRVSLSRSSNPFAPFSITVAAFTSVALLHSEKVYEKRLWALVTVTTHLKWGEEVVRSMHVHIGIAPRFSGTHCCYHFPSPEHCRLRMWSFHEHPP